MRPFEFIVLFLSFIYTLALTHLLFAWTRMIRHRRQLVLSWPHLLWMIAALFTLSANWLSLWDFRNVQVLSLSTVAAGLVLVVEQYFLCALVSPDFDDGETYDMKHFHACEGRTYMIAFLVLVLFAIGINFLAGATLNMANWGRENALVILQLPFILLPLVIRRNWAQILGPASLLLLVIAYAVTYYPVLS